MRKSELVPQQVFNSVGYRFNLLAGRVLPTQERWEALQTPFYQGQRHLHSHAVHVSDRPTDSYGETGVVGSSS